MMIRSISSSLEEPPSSLPTDENSLIDHCQKVKNDLMREGVPPAWRISPQPFQITLPEWETLQKLGPALSKFYKIQNKLYFESLKGIQPEWISGYLDLGKPQQLVEFGRMNRFKSALPGILRPDLILMPGGGMVISELDSVPGGFGLTHLFNASYEKLGYPVIGGSGGMTGGFKEMIFSLVRLSNKDDKNIHLGLIVSEESRDYLPEMTAFARALNCPDFFAEVYRPDEIFFTEETLLGRKESFSVPLNVLYRFFELFDYKNIPKIDLLLYAAKKEKATMTPPVKPFLEEKMWFALFHHPVLKPYWEKELGEDVFGLLQTMIPKTWILDSRVLPPYGIIPDLTFRRKPVSRWQEIFSAGQKERRFVIKPSGFSELAWGARGVKIGHDLSGQEWEASLEEALSSFPRIPHLLQTFHQGRKEEVHYLEASGQSLVKMTGRVRLCPYYFTTQDEILLGGVLATVCPVDKKIIHGMTDAVMAPCVAKI